FPPLLRHPPRPLAGLPRREGARRDVRPTSPDLMPGLPARTVRADCPRPSIASCAKLALLIASRTSSLFVRPALKLRRPGGPEQPPPLRLLTDAVPRVTAVAEEIERIRRQSCSRVRHEAV